MPRFARQMTEIDADFAQLVLVDQQQVGLDMAFAASCPFTAKTVVAVACSQRLIKHQRCNNRLQVGTERRLVLPFAFTLEVAL